MNFFLLTQSSLIFIPFRIRAAWIRIRNYFFRIRIRPKVSDPTGSGSTTLHTRRQPPCTGCYDESKEVKRSSKVKIKKPLKCTFAAVEFDVIFKCLITLKLPFFWFCLTILYILRRFLLKFRSKIYFRPLTFTFQDPDPDPKLSLGIRPLEEQMQ